jgi:hypothetical protein
MAGLLRLVPVAARVDSPAVKPVALVAQQDPAPAPPLIAAEPVAPVLTPEPPAPAPVAALTQAAEPPVISRPRVRVPVQSVRRPAKPESYAIRVTGGDVEPAPVLAVASPSHHQSLDPPEPPVTEAAALPEPPPVIESSADPAAAPAKPAAAGNRLVRALGKVNPFRRGAARSQFKKD